MSVKITYFVHGTTTDNEQDLATGWAPGELSELGKEQAKDLGELGERQFYKREIAAFEPIYMAFYLQDKFAFNDLIFNIGMRVDRYDANQKVQKDPYLVFDAYTVSDLKNTELNLVQPDEVLGPARYLLKCSKQWLACEPVFLRKQRQLR